MSTICRTSITRKTITMALSLLLIAISVLVLANPAGALPPPGNPGDGDGIHNLPPSGAFTISPNPALVSSSPLSVQAHAIPVGNPIIPVQTGDNVTFNASASTDDHKILNYEWDLDGNGSFETHGVLAKIEHKRYYQTGQYTIRLRVTDAQGLDDVVTHVLTIRNPPHAVIAANVPVPLVGQQVTYSAAGSTGDPGIAKYDWDLDGNGTFETSTGTVPSVTTSYQSAGTRNVAVRVTDTLGTAATASVKEIVNQAPTAAFTDAPSPAFVGETVKFDGSSSSDDNPIADYAWDLDGNGTFETDTHANPTVTKKYTAVGTVDVRLRVTDSNGVTSIVLHPLTVNPAPPAGTKSGTTNTGGTTATAKGPKVTITPRIVKISKKGVVTLRVTCPKSHRQCEGGLAIRSKTGKKLGSGQFLAGGGQTAIVHVHLVSSALKLVKPHHSIKAKALATATDIATGSTAKATTSATITIKR